MKFYECPEQHVISNSPYEILRIFKEILRIFKEIIWDNREKEAQ
jgi:hypothetical protein